MSVIKARFVGHPDGVDVTIPLDNGEIRHRHIPHGGELPVEIDGLKVSTAYRNGLLAQKDNWTEVKRATGAEATGKTTAAKADTKEG